MTLPCIQLIRSKITATIFFALALALPLAAQEYIAKVERYGVEQGLSHRQVNSICKDQRGFLWIGTPYGLNRFDGHSFRWYTKSTDGFPFDDIQTIHVDSDGWFWVFKTNYTALFFYKPETGEIKTREARFGKTVLPTDLENFHDVIPSAFSDDLLFTFYQTPDFYTWEQGKGFRKVVVRDCANFSAIKFASDSTVWGINTNRGQSDTLWEVDLNGITTFYPDNFYDNPPDAEIHLELSGCTVFNAAKNKLLDQLTGVRATNTLTLLPDDANFNLTFALLDFEQPAQILYAWKIANPDRSSPGDIWHYQKENQISMGRLPYGNYTLRIRGQAANGHWSKQEKVIRILVVRPFYATWWCWLSLLVLAVLAIRRFVRWRTRVHEAENLRLEREVNRQTATIRQQSEALQRLDNAKSRFYDDITHEFRTPLTVILGMARQIRDAPQKHLDSGIGLIEKNGKSLLRLIDQLLDVSKLEHHSFKLTLRQSDILPYLRYLTESLQSFAESKNLSLRFSSTLESLVMGHDPQQIKQILTNLIANAIKFTPAGGTIDVAVNAVDSQLHIEVRDTGIGISEVDLLHIFDRFYQVENAHTRQGQGSGIGLAHARELVNVMGGILSVESEPGKGAVFTVQLPIKNDVTEVSGDALEPAVTPETGAFDLAPTLASLPTILPEFVGADPADSTLPTLLLIEDNPDVVAYLMSCLEDSYQLEVAYNGKTGIEKALENIPDLVLSDIMMPEKDGYGVCDTLKNDERTSHIPIVLLTAKADVESRIAGLRRGADAYLAKPFHQEELLFTLVNLLEQRRKWQEQFGNIALEAPPTETLATAAGMPPTDLEIEDAFLKKLRQQIEKRLDDPGFDGPRLAQFMHLSEVQLYRKIKALTGKSTAIYIRSVRLHMALDLLQNTELPVSKIAYAVGFEDPNYFSRTFSQEFGVAPSEMRK